ncbi:MAG: hypothetical protein HUU37_09705 [Bdellovibrionales bacterium]|nr:hypothetical protein [Bdellovibrionales bacterium]
MRIFSVLLLATALPAGASYVAQKPAPAAAAQAEGAFDPGYCGQRCSFTTASEVLSYYATYMRSSEQFTDPVQQAKVKAAFQSCIQGSGACTASDRELLLQRAAAANMFRNVRRMILENNTNAQNMKSLGKDRMDREGKKDPFLVSPELQARMNAELQRLGKSPLHPDELTPERRKPFKIDPQKLDLRVDEGTLLEGGFAREYDYVLGNYVRPGTGHDTQLTAAYENPAAAGYGHVISGESKKSMEQTHKTSPEAAGRGAVVEVDHARYQEDLATQSHANMERARQEFQQKIKTRDLRKTFDPKTGRYAVDLKSTGVQDLNLKGIPGELIPLEEKLRKSLTNPIDAHEIAMGAYRKAAERINSSVDAAIADKSKDGSVQAVTYSIDVNEFDKFIEEVWPAQARKR